MSGAQRYRIERSIRKGGTAELFEGFAVGQQGFRRRVAIKRLLPEHAGDPVATQRFADEALLSSHLHHAGIVSVIDFGVLDGLPFQVLELVDGLDASTLLERSGPLPAALALHIATELAHALAYAHQARGDDGRSLGIVHRDVSPENVLLSFAGEVKLADFGIAAGLERRAPTAAGLAHGKLPFMAPEQLRGELADPRGDVFAAGCVLHTLVAGKSPMESEAARREVLAGAPVPLATSVPPDIARILAHALAPSKAARPDASSLASACARALRSRSSEDGRGALAAHLAAHRSAPARHPLSELMRVELVLEEESAGVRRFASVIARTPAEARTAVDEPISVPKSAPLRLEPVEALVAALPVTQTALEDPWRQPRAPTGVRTTLDQEIVIETPAVISARPDSTGPTGPTIDRTPASSSSDHLTGRVVREYVIGELLGKGGYARVYRADHLGLGRHCALKVLHATHAAPVHRKRLEREAEALAAIDHPHLVKVLEIVVEEDLTFLVMELIEGHTLQRLLDVEHQLDVRRARKIIRQITAGVAEAHRRGFVHRDLKPSNVMLSTAQGAETVKVLDFGMAKMIDPDQTRLTAPGNMVGTPRWMAPEQIAGRADVGPKADLYAIGAMLYRMITGRPPFEGNADEVLDKHLHQPAPPLPVEGELASLVASLLEKRPEDRPESADHVLQVLDRIEREEAATAILPFDVREETPPRPVITTLPRDVTQPPRSRTGQLSVREQRPWRLARIAALAAGVAVLVIAGLRLLPSEPPDLASEPAPEPVRIEPAARPGPPPVTAAAAAVAEPDPAEEAPAPAPAPIERTDRKSRVTADDGARPIAGLKAALDAALASKHVSLRDLAAVESMSRPIERWRRAVEATDPAAAAAAQKEILRGLPAAAIDPELLELRLRRIKQALSSQSARLESGRLAELESRYLDLRSAIAGAPSVSERSRLARRIAALEADVSAD